MINLEDYEGNVLIVTAHFDADSDDSEKFTAALNERFEKWGQFTIVNSHDPRPTRVTIDDANPVKSTHSMWMDDFTDFARDTRFDFTIQWIPYVNAYKNGFSVDIVNGKIATVSALVWGATVDVVQGEG